MSKYASCRWNKEKYPINKLTLNRWLRASEYILISQEQIILIIKKDSLKKKLRKLKKNDNFLMLRNNTCKKNKFSRTLHRNFFFFNQFSYLLIFSFFSGLDSKVCCVSASHLNCKPVRQIKGNFTIFKMGHLQLSWITLLQ